MTPSDINKWPASAQEKSKEALESEFGSSFNVRCLITNENPTEGRCLRCEAHGHIRELEEMNVDQDQTFISVQILRDALIFVLENIDWPTDGGPIKGAKNDVD